MILAVNICEETVEAWRVAGTALLVLKILVPSIIIITGIVPLFNALISGTYDKSLLFVKTLFKKIMAGLIVFLVPTLITSSINLLAKNSENEDSKICSECFDNPTDKKCNDYVLAFKKKLEDEIVNFKDAESYLEGSLELEALKDADNDDNDELGDGSDVEKGTERPPNNLKGEGYIYYLSTQGTNPSYWSGSNTTNLSMIIKGSTNEIALYDTGLKNTCNFILDQIKAINNNDLTIKYLFISHSHNDHIGCFNTIISKARVENVVIKDITRERRYRELANNARERGINVINTTTLPEGYALTLGNLNLYLYNNQDVHAGKKCNQVTTLRFYRNHKLSNAVRINGNYIVMKNTLAEEYVLTSSQNSKWYYAESMQRYTCSENANSVAVLVEVNLPNGDHRYAYLPGDLENNGYPEYGEYDSTYHEKIFGPGINAGVVIKNGRIEKSDRTVYYAAEHEVARRIANKLGYDLNKITIYQQSHHGYNTALDALKILWFTDDRPAEYPLYSIATTPKEQYTYTTNHLQMSSYEKLSGNNRFVLSSGTSKNHLTCKISVDGSTSCYKE